MHCRCNHNMRVCVNLFQKRLLLRTLAKCIPGVRSSVSTWMHRYFEAGSSLTGQSDRFQSQKRSCNGLHSSSKRRIYWHVSRQSRRSKLLSSLSLSTQNSSPWSIINYLIRLLWPRSWKNMTSAVVSRKFRDISVTGIFRELTICKKC